MIRFAATRHYLDTRKLHRHRIDASTDAMRLFFRNRQRAALRSIAERHDWRLDEKVSRNSAVGIASDIFVKCHPASQYRRHKSQRGSASHLATGHFLTNHLIGAFSGRELDVYVVGVFDGLINSFSEMASFALCDRTFLPWLGSAEEENCRPDTRATPPIGLRWKHPGVGDSEYTPIPQCTRRRDASKVLTSLMTMFVLQHEAGHICKGHCDYFALGRENPMMFDMLEAFTDPGPLDDQHIIGLLEHLRELEADDFALRASYSESTLRILKRKFRNMHFTRAQWIEITTSAICLFFCLLCILEELSAPKTGAFQTHPLAACRAKRFVSGIRKGKWTDFKKSSIEEKAITVGMLSIDALARRHKSFSVLAGSIREKTKYCTNLLSLLDDAKELLNLHLSEFRIID